MSKQRRSQGRPPHITANMKKRALNNRVAFFNSVCKFSFRERVKVAFRIITKKGF
jgi:hypothetical protein